MREDSIEEYVKAFKDSTPQGHDLDDEPTLINQLREIHDQAEAEEVQKDNQEFLLKI